MSEFGSKQVVLIMVVVFFIGVIAGAKLEFGNKPPVQYVSNTQVFFSTHDSCTDEIIRLIGRSNSTIHIAIYSFTSKPIADALIVAVNRGITVKIISEPSQFSSSSQIPRLQDITKFTVLMDDGPGIMHNKFMVVDSSIVTTGSFNWSNNAEYDNAENMLTIRDSDIAALYKAEWDWIARNRVK